MVWSDPGSDDGQIHQDDNQIQECDLKTDPGTDGLIQ